MDACTGFSTIQLIATAFTFLFAVLWLDVFWVRSPDELHQGDIAAALRKRTWLSAFVAFGAAGAAILLLFWVGTCTNGTL
jgi:hypothetical protein